MKEPPERHIVLRDRKFDVERVELERRDGGSEVRHFLRHPGAAVIVPVLPDGRLVLIEQYRHAIDRTLLELPAGTLEWNEVPEVCAHRELEEETGYRAGQMTRLGGFFLCPGLSDEYQHVYVATDLERRAQSLDPTERINVVTLAENELRRRARSGQVEDAKTLAALFAWWSRSER